VQRRRVIGAVRARCGHKCIDAFGADWDVVAGKAQGCLKKGRCCGKSTRLSEKRIWCFSFVTCKLLGKNKHIIPPKNISLPHGYYCHLLLPDLVDVELVTLPVNKRLIFRGKVNLSLTRLSLGGGDVVLGKVWKLRRPSFDTRCLTSISFSDRAFLSPWISYKSNYRTERAKYLIIRRHTPGLQPGGGNRAIAPPEIFKIIDSC